MLCLFINLIQYISFKKDLFFCTRIQKVLRQLKALSLTVATNLGVNYLQDKTKIMVIFNLIFFYILTTSVSFFKLGIATKRLDKIKNTPIFGKKNN